MDSCLLRLMLQAVAASQFRVGTRDRFELLDFLMNREHPRRGIGTYRDSAARRMDGQCF